MIRKLQKTDINQVAEIWLDTNIKAHHFIPATYWKEHFDSVKEMFSQAEIYVYEDERQHQIQGFIGLDANYIAGIFVQSDAWSQGIGRQLLDYVKEFKSKLHLNVYQKNTKAIKFYQREQFYIQGESIDETTGEKEYLMVWNKDT